MNFLQVEFGEVKVTPTGEWKINSPYANDTKFHLYINPDKGVFYDQKTQHKGTVFGFIAEHLQISPVQVIQKLVQDYGAGPDLNYKPEDYIPKAKNLELPSGLHFFSEAGTGPIRNQAYKYLVNRGIPEASIRELGYIYEPGTPFDKSIFIPFYENGQLVYFITRDFTGNKILRYRNPSGFDSKEFIFNHDKIRDELFIFEGVMDALSLEGQVGTAILSADLSNKQIDKIVDILPKRVIFVPDNDETGKKTLAENIDRFFHRTPPSFPMEIYIYRLKNFKDFNESGLHHISLSDCERWNERDARLEAIANGE
jgi:DNA primase